MRSLMLLAALSLAACAPAVVTVPVASVPVVLAPAPAARCAISGTGKAETLLYGAETAYNVPAHAYVTADGNGQLTPALKARVKPVLQQAFRALGLARIAYCAKDAAGLASYVELAKSFAYQAKALLPAAK